MSNFPLKYIPKKTTKKDKKKLLLELKKSKKMYKKKKYYTRKKVKSFRSKKSRHILNAEKIYNISNVKPGKELSKKTGCSVEGLNKIVKKGQGAYFSSGSRPNQTPFSWALARLASVLTFGPSLKVDKDIVLKYGKGKFLKDAKKKIKY